MTSENTNPTGSASAVGSGNIVLLGGNRQSQSSASPRKSQDDRACPLFNPRTREQALCTAHELNAAAVRCRAAARTHPGTTGLALNRLAGHYAGMARDWFGRADTYPQGGHA